MPMRNANRLINEVLSQWLSERIAGKGFVLAMETPLENVDAQVLKLYPDSILRKYKRSIGKELNAAFNYIYAPHKPLRLFVMTNAKYWLEFISRQADEKTRSKVYDYVDAPSDRPESEVAIDIGNRFKTADYNLEDFVRLLVPGENRSFDKYWDCFTRDGDHIFMGSNTAWKKMGLVAGYKVDVQIDAEVDDIDFDISSEAAIWLRSYVGGSLLGRGAVPTDVMAELMSGDIWPRPVGDTVAYRGAHLAAIQQIYNADLGFYLTGDVLDSILKGERTIETAVHHTPLTENDVAELMRELRREIARLAEGLEERFGLKISDLKRGAKATVVGPSGGDSDAPSSWSRDPRIARAFMDKDRDADSSIELLFRASIDAAQVLVDFTLWPRSVKDAINSEYMAENEVIALGKVEATVSTIKIPPSTQMVIDRYDAIMAWEPKSA